MDNVDVDLPVILNIDAVINLIDDLVMTAVDVVDYVALVAVNVAKIQVLLRRAHLFVRLRRFLRMMLRLGWFWLWQITHAVRLF
jgi:hypothetical protein